ncbi:14113_t:CDS:1 [Funneliformis mosseae]|uniref:14113_t:CDS:1 n=1 Tax=Funneliformis mosseae TaxID=27381 RepID=A0A9N9GE24_FUNMO|nr:14113_t:CDS:1 [Funneliformis mosseae]
MTIINLLSEIRTCLFEKIANTATLTITDLEDVNLNAFRTMLNVDFDYVCWIKESTEEYWIRILDDRLLKFLFSTYYVNSERIFIVFRSKGQPSPNLSIDDCFQKLSLSTTSVDNDIEPFTETPLKELDSTEIMIIENIAVSWSLFSDFITSKLGEGVSLLNISLSAEKGIESQSGVVTFCVDIKVLHKQVINLISCENKKLILITFVFKGADCLLELFTSTCENIMSYEIELKKLHKEDESLFYKIQIFVNDLLTFDSSEDARSRLDENPTAKILFSDVYFSVEEIEYLLSFPTSSGLPVSILLNVALSDKINSYQLCTSHDLAPQQVFNVRKGFQKENGFKNNLKKFEKTGKRGVIYIKLLVELHRLTKVMLVI